MYFMYHNVFYLLIVCYFMFVLCQLSKTLPIFQIKEDLEVASQYISNAIRDFYEMNYPVRLKNTPTCVPWWNRGLSKLRIGVRKQLKRTRKTNVFCDWERFKEAQHIYKKANGAKRYSWETFCESIEIVPEASRSHRILSKEPNDLSFLMEAIPSQWRGL